MSFREEHSAITDSQYLEYAWLSVFTTINWEDPRCIFCDSHIIKEIKKTNTTSCKSFNFMLDYLFLSVLLNLTVPDTIYKKYFYFLQMTFMFY